MAQDDAALVLRSLRDSDEFGKIYRRHGKSITAFVRRRVPAGMVDDIVSDTFLAAFRVRKRYDLSRPDAKPWLMGIAMNVIRNTLKREYNASRLPPRPPPPVDPVDDLVDRLSSREQLAALVAPNVRPDDIALLHMLSHGYTYAEIAAALNLPDATIRSRIYRLRQRLPKQDRDPDATE